MHQLTYNTIFKFAPLPMWLFDIDTLQFLQVNETACSVYGYTQEEFLSMTICDIRPPEDIPRMKETLANTLKKRNPSDLKVFRHLKKNGDIIHAKIMSNLIPYEDKEVMLIIIVDVSTEIEIQNKLNDVNSKLKIASDITGLGYWTNDLITSEILWTDELYKIFELDPNTFTLTLDSVRNLFHPDDQKYISNEVLNGREELSIIESERRIITGKGTIKWIYERLNTTKDKEGKMIKIEGITLDITERKKQEIEIKESEERFKILAKATVEAIIDWDIQKDKVIWGEGFQTLFGYDLSVYDNHLWSKNIHPDDKEKVLRELANTIENPNEQNFNAEFRFLKADRSIAYVQHRGVFIRDDNGVAIRAMAGLIDITETLERMHLIESQGKALKDISWTQSHIVRAPLSNLLGLIYLLEENIETGLSDKELIGYIRDSANKLDDIIKDIVSKTD